MVPRFDVEPVSGEVIPAIEKRMGRALPSQYRDFLASGLGGEPQPNGWGEGKYACVVDLVYRAPEALRLIRSSDVANGRLSIASEATGNEFAIDLADAAVYFVDHELLAIESDRAFARVAESFSEFLEKFSEDEE